MMSLFSMYLIIKGLKKVWRPELSVVLMTGAMIFAAWEIICVKLPASKARGEYKMMLLRVVLLMVTDFKLGCEMGNFGG